MTLTAVFIIAYNLLFLHPLNAAKTNTVLNAETVQKEEGGKVLSRQDAAKALKLNLISNMNLGRNYSSD